MTTDEIKERVAAIGKIAWDDEVAHGQEDQLYADVLRYLAAGLGEAAELAREALKTEEISFARWCA